MLPGKWSHGRNSWGMGQRGLCPQYFPNALKFSMVAQWRGFSSSHQIFFLIFSHQIPWKSFSALLLELTTLPIRLTPYSPLPFTPLASLFGHLDLYPNNWMEITALGHLVVSKIFFKLLSAVGLLCTLLSAYRLSHRWCLILLLFAGDVGLSGLADASFEPMPSTPEVVPVGGRLEIRCLLPQGVPTPVHRLVSCCFCDNWQHAVCQT